MENVKESPTLFRTRASAIRFSKEYRLNTVVLTPSRPAALALATIYGIFILFIPFPYLPMSRHRIRIRYNKLGRLKFIGHHDLLRTFEALFRRTRLPLAMSSGFHPKVRMSFPDALPLGYESTDEVFDLELTETVDVDTLLADLNRQTLEGLAFLSARFLAEGEKKVRLISSVYRMTVVPELRTQTAERIASFLAETSVIVPKRSGKRVDVRVAVLQLVLDETTGELTVELQTQTGPEAGIKEVLAVLGLGKELFVTLFPQRVCCSIPQNNNRDNE
ncbi:MAG: TIGR03936 family radical SAM-associated protein [Planctomycetaceae bacterium]|nr:TIGR03936 family radical SAM-associated protein [Planctomycetaceae bacterium]